MNRPRQPGEMPAISSDIPNLTSADLTTSIWQQFRDEVRAITPQGWRRIITVIGFIVSLIIFCQWAGDGRLWGYKHISPEEAHQFVGRQVSINVDSTTDFVVFRAQDKTGDVYLNFNARWPRETMSARIYASNTKSIAKALSIPFAPHEDEERDPQMLDLWVISGRLTTHADKPRIDITSPDDIITFTDHAAVMSDAQDAADNIPRR